MSPTTPFSPSGVYGSAVPAGWPGGEVYPGYGMAGWVREGYTGTQPGTSQDPIFSIFKAKTHTHGQMKANYDCFMRFPGTGSEWVLN